VPLSTRSAPVSFGSPLHASWAPHHVHQQLVRFSSNQGKILEQKIEDFGAESITEGTLVEWRKQVGDVVSKGELLAEIETDKVSIEVKAAESGTITELLVAADATVSKGQPLLKLAVGSGSGAPATASAPPPAAEAGATAPAATTAAAEVPKSAAGPARIVDIKVSDFGAESITEGTLVEWSKKVGQPVAKGELLATIETDKVSVEVKAEEGGILKELLAELDSTVEAGKVIAKIEVGGDMTTAAVATPGPAAEAASVVPPMADTAHATQLTGLRSAFAKLAAQRSGLPWPPAAATTVKVKAVNPHVAAPAAAVPATPAGGADERPTERRVPLSRVRQHVMQRMKDAQNTTALLTTFQEADMSTALALLSKYRDLFQKKHGAPLGLLSLFAKASANALAEVPAINAVIDDATSETVFRDYVDLSVPIPSPRGPVSCVLQNVESMSVKDIELTIQDLVKKAAKDALSIEDMSGPTFGINDSGVAGGMLGTSIVNPPQSAVMGTNAITQRAVAMDGKATARPVMYLSLTYDHRLIDGREAVTFLCSVRDKMQDPARLLIDL